MNGPIKKEALIPPIHVFQPTFEGDEDYGILMVRNQQHPNVVYKLQSPFIEYASCTCEWAIHGNLCKHKVLVLLTSTDLAKDNIIKYCGTWFGSNCGGFQAMFTNMVYLQRDDRVSNDKDNEDGQVEEPRIIDINGFMTMNVNVLDTNEL
jgi:hypothetical protein